MTSTQTQITDLDSSGSYVHSLPALEEITELDVYGNHAQTPEFTLAPVDSGFGAWSFLASAFFIEAIVWGFPYSYGLYLDEYLNDEMYTSQPHSEFLLPLIGPLSTGIIYSSSPILYTFCGRYPQHRRKLLWFGAFICWGSLFGASYAKKLPQLVALQGILYAIGGGLLYAPFISFLAEWFVARRGLANGIIFAGTSVGGCVIPSIIPSLFDKYGVSVTLRYYSVIILGLLLPILPFVKGRLPHTSVIRPRTRRTAAVLLSPTFITIMVLTTLQSFAYFVPLTWLPTFARDMNTSKSNSSLALALQYAASIIGRLTLGYLADKLNPWMLALVNLSASCLVTFVLWGFLSYSLGGLITFGIFYGIIAGGWTSLWTGLLKLVVKDDPTLITTLFGYMMLCRGIGNIASTPISSKFYNLHHNLTDSSVHLGFDVGGGRFKVMIVYVGTIFAGASGVAFIAWYNDSRMRRAQRRAHNETILLE